MLDDNLNVLGSWKAVTHDAYYENKKKQKLIGPAHQYTCFGEAALVAMVEEYGSHTQSLGV